MNLPKTKIIGQNLFSGKVLFFWLFYQSPDTGFTGKSTILTEREISCKLLK